MGTTLFLSACGKNYHIQLLKELHQQGKAREVEAIRRILESYVTLKTTTIYKGEEDKSVEKSWEGMGIVYGNNVITLDHVVSIYSVREQITPYMYVESPIEKIKEETKLNDATLEAKVKDQKTDIAVFKLPTDYKGAKFPFELGDSDKVEYGQEVLLIGNPHGEGYNVREGIVSNKIKNGIFNISALVELGDSGTGTVDRNTFALLGLNAQKWWSAVTGVKSINLYKPYL